MTADIIDINRARYTKTPVQVPTIITEARASCPIREGDMVQEKTARTGQKRQRGYVLSLHFCGITNKIDMAFVQFDFVRSWRKVEDLKNISYRNH